MEKMEFDVSDWTKEEKDELYNKWQENYTRHYILRTKLCPNCKYILSKIIVENKKVCCYTCGDILPISLSEYEKLNLNE